MENSDEKKRYSASYLSPKSCRNMREEGAGRGRAQMVNSLNQHHRHSVGLDCNKETLSGKYDVS